MKILLVNKFHYKKGGSETYYFTLADTLRAKGHEVVFFAMKDEERNRPCKQSKYFVSNASVQGSVRSKLNMVIHIVYSKEAYENMKLLLEGEKPDLVILNLVHKQITLSIVDAIRKYNANLPIFWTMHDLIAVCPSYTMLDGKGTVCEKCLHGDFRPCVRNRCIKGSILMSMLSKYEADYIKKKKWYDQIDLFICPSEFYQKKLTEANFTTAPIVTMRNPLPLDTVYELNDKDEGYFLYFGRLSMEKGIKTLIGAAHKISCRLVILGTGPIEVELQEYVRKEKIQKVEFRGFQTGNSLTDCIRKARCVVLPSEWYENGPYSAMEAMALGKPLIVSDMGGLPELVEDSVNGFVSEPGKLSSCLERMMKLSEREYKTMAQNALMKAQTLFDPGRYIDELLEYYESACMHNDGLSE